ncbi:hypothetical protein [Siccirubricoccus sp. G192]|uniref:hypothetical protein n=1 Tax=Siccirubricoccus sp. G192 TaxID=2849651 RepID=UPI001C2C0DF9|nr:hypothetical protein [Siccirubricoccus sp. G192]MBV1796324.1 hypothetical protein [Siccirubricoccus sp. G192]
MPFRIPGSGRGAELPRLLLRYALTFRMQAVMATAGDLAGLLPVMIGDAPGPIRARLP